MTTVASTASSGYSFRSNAPSQRTLQPKPSLIKRLKDFFHSYKLNREWKRAAKEVTSISNLKTLSSERIEVLSRNCPEELAKAYLKIGKPLTAATKRVDALLSKIKKYAREVENLNKQIKNGEAKKKGKRIEKKNSLIRKIKVLSGELTTSIDDASTSHKKTRRFLNKFSSATLSNLRDKKKKYPVSKVTIPAARLENLFHFKELFNKSVEEIPYYWKYNNGNKYNKKIKSESSLYDFQYTPPRHHNNVTFNKEDQATLFKNYTVRKEGNLENAIRRRHKALTNEIKGLQKEINKIEKTNDILKEYENNLNENYKQTEAYRMREIKQEARIKSEKDVIAKLENDITKFKEYSLLEILLGKPRLTEQQRLKRNFALGKVAEHYSTLHALVQEERHALTEQVGGEGAVQGLIVEHNMKKVPM